MNSSSEDCDKWDDYAFLTYLAECGFRFRPLLYKLRNDETVHHRKMQCREAQNILHDMQECSRESVHKQYGYFSLLHGIPYALRGNSILTSRFANLSDHCLNFGNLYTYCSWSLSMLTGNKKG